MNTFPVQYAFFVARWSIAVPLAIAFTFALFVLMLKLILHDYEEPIDTPTTKINPPIYEAVEIEEFPDVEPAEKPIIEQTPETPDRLIDLEVDTEISIPNLSVAVDKRGGMQIGFSGMPIAQYQVQPKYPVRAINRGIEGYVDVRFDITKFGATENVRIISALPEGVFEKAAMAAVMRWRYQPRTKDGVAVGYRDMTQRLRFQLDN